jgi:eukaryotic-like serine/threonine-protein kinase
MDPAARKQDAHTPLAAASPDAAVSINDRYDLVGELARGGMGEVHLCHDRRIGRDVALKLIRNPDAVTEQKQQRFLREARVQGQLEHPSIVPVYDLSRDDQGREFFTMRRLSGATLSFVIERLAAGDAEIVRRFTRHKLLSAFLQVCLAVDYAHNRGVIHRDIKPSNIMLGDFGEVYLLDWGLARIDNEQMRTGDTLEPEVTLTIEGQLLGTPGYMSPEQAVGEAEIDGRSDIYSLGVVLFEMLALEPLHGSGATSERIRSTHLGADARVSVRAPQRDVPPELDTICQQATAWKPANRYASARELHDAVERVLEGEQDLSLRQSLADQHALTAKAAVERALAGRDNNARAEALRELGQALALAPDKRELLELFSSLVNNPPPELPADADAEQAASYLGEVKKARAFEILSLVVMAVLGVLTLSRGVKDWRWVAIIFVPLLTGTASLALMGQRERIAISPLGIGGLILIGVSVAGTTGYLGPLLLTPSLAVLLVVMVSATPALPRMVRVTTLTVSCLALAIPTFLEWGGVTPPIYEFSDQSLRIKSAIVEMSEAHTRITLLLTNLALLLIPTMHIGRLRAANETLRSQLFLRKWHLQQLVPKVADAALPPRP